MVTVEIYPCLDSLLYFPIYLAIDLYQDGAGRTLVERPENGRESPLVWRFGVPEAVGGEVCIKLHKPLNGDRRAIEMLQQPHPEDSVPVAIADPMTVLEVADPPGELKILATFINRIALWPVLLKPKGRSLGQNGPARAVRKRKFLQDISNRRLSLREFKEEFGDLLRIGYCSSGETTKRLLKYFLGDDLLETTVNDFGVTEIKTLFNDNNPVDILFTNTPWLAEPMRERYYSHQYPQEAVSARRCFPAIPYPFSSLIASREIIEKEAQTTAYRPLLDFIRRLNIAIALSYRETDSVIHRLTELYRVFRNFGLSGNLGKGRISAIVDQAVNSLIGDDCFSEELRNSWIHWDFAFESDGEEIELAEWRDKYRNWVANIERACVEACIDAGEDMVYDFRKCLDASRQRLVSD